MGRKQTECFAALVAKRGYIVLDNKEPHKCIINNKLTFKEVWVLLFVPGFVPS